MLSYSRQLIDEDDIEAVINVLKSDYLTQGPHITKFEEDLCSYTGAKYAVVFNSATSALSAAYHAMDLKKDDEVITTPISFVATSNMFVDLGVKPVWCDVKLDGNIDESKIASLITSKTKAIVPVDFAGKPVEIDIINEIAKENNLIVIDDASHALGSTIKEKKVGSLADMTIFSFHAIKPITTGEGGAVLTDNKEYVEKLRLFRSHGIVKKQLWNSDMVSMGYNLRMTDMAAALGSSQLKKLDKFVEQRTTIAQYYDDAFSDQNYFLTQEIEKNTLSSRHLYPILLHPEFHCLKEDIFQDLRNRGLGVQVHYKPIYKNSFYTKQFASNKCEVAEDFYLSEISIPCNQTMSIEDAQKVVQTILDVLKAYKC